MLLILNWPDLFDTRDCKTSLWRHLTVFGCLNPQDLGVYHRKWYRHSLLLSVSKLLKFISLLHRSIWNQLLLKQYRNKNALSLNVSFIFRSFIGNPTYWKETEKWNTSHFWMSTCVEKNQNKSLHVKYSLLSETGNNLTKFWK